uniref:Uncharacterized protein LOC116947023 isoform X1 n=2 Tax=Petromyzon marinus TaxID=7757 RepID=A0AAJ7TKH8_PETMA|nr:uncharacterized protein LOC116947023 isoform X1 [Petromyzon marinus]XP_032818265.1 uncharacterized protein LOC116947023 isoform X1 [Petromyzon marinus]XP_032818266.1 uncharacterized protein LOC116947023 isoform X1 [Petromyzon marinus]XP_032818267.1 uncharacterized protein LOC116947023 isoform X1 [Petromyzon marinus]XP_032818268.1 uncharacterized protein LOC116947023 isoform X1 [Petromyzon marinus]XP_032818270.1 uncharacterized protein LOC116947023 isoform X1 [Petromyzon marinus]XP_03281827
MTNRNGHRPLRTRLAGAAGPWHAAAMERSREMPAPGRFEGGDTSRTRWTHEETLALLSILKQMNVGGAMDARNQRNTPFFLRVMELLRQRGIACWTLTQVRVRWKNLKARYLMARRARERGGGGGGGIGGAGGGVRDRGKGAFAYFKEINEIIGGRPCVAVTREGHRAGVAGDRHVEPGDRRCYEFREEDHVEPNFKQEAMESKSHSPPYFAEVEVSGFTDHMDMAQGVKEEVEDDVESYSPQCNFEGDTAGTACIVPRSWTSNVDVTGESAAPSTSLGGAVPPRPCSGGGGGSSSDGSGAGDLPAQQRAYLGAQERMLLRLQRSSQEASFAFQRELQADEMRLLEPHLQAAAGVAASFLGVMERLSSLLEATVRDLPFASSAAMTAAAGDDRAPSSPTPQTPGQAPPTSNQSRGEQAAPPRSPPHHRRHHHRRHHLHHLHHQGLLADADVDGPVPSLGPHGRAANGDRSHGDETETETPTAASPVAGTAAASSAARRDARTPLLATSSPPRRLGYGGHKLPARFRTAEK